MVSRISRNSRSRNSAFDPLPWSLVNTARASSCRSCSMSQRGLSWRNQIPAAMTSPGTTWKARGKRPVPQISYFLRPIMRATLTLEVTVHLKAPVAKPLCNKEAPRQHPLKQTTELSTVLRRGDFGLSLESANTNGNSEEGLTQYIGTTAESKPTEMPAMNRPAIIIGMFLAPA